jgi:hypothetical protein
MPKEAPRETPRPRNYVPHACASDASCPPRLRGAGWAVSGGHTGSCERTPSSELRLLHGSPSRTLGKSAHRHGGLEVDVVRRSVAPGSSLGGHTRQNVERWADRRGGRLPAPVEDRPRSVVIDGLKERERPGWTSSLGCARSTQPAPPSGQPGRAARALAVRGGGGRVGAVDGRVGLDLVGPPYGLHPLAVPGGRGGVTAPGE